MRAVAVGRLRNACHLGLLLVLPWLPACDANGPAPGANAEIASEAGSSLQALRARNAELKRHLAQQVPSGHYIIVDTARNRLYLKRRNQTLLEALVSTGSGTMLDKPDQPGARWVFDTPRGEFSIQSRLTNPVWVKPDWAFLEEGLDVPANSSERIEAGILGDYALGFGKGYFIHGTLYTRLLGKNVTHGCIRLNDDDLKSVYKVAKVGTPVMIF